ncbi:MAG: amidohydrolase family protein [Vicinamibacterales bacterium]
MRLHVASIATLLLLSGCAAPPQPTADPDIAAFVDKIRAVDNHSHANSTTPGDADADALPLDGVAPFEMPATLRPEHPNWEAARQALEAVPVGQGDKRPALVLDQIGVEVMLANRIAMGPGLAAPRFRWVSYVDALMLPLSTKLEAASSPDREQLFPLEDRLLQRYFTQLNVSMRPATLDGYLKTIVTPTLESQRRGGCVAVKFEAAYLRSLDFGDAPQDRASQIYAKFAGGGEPPPADYRLLQDFLFRYIAREAGRLGMAVHIHSFEGAGNYFRTADADPLLLEGAFNDPSLRQTSFVIVHGGGVFADHAGAMLWKPNVYVDTSLMALAYPPDRLAGILRSWLSQYPEKVLFGTDAVAISADTGWEIAAWVATKNARAALASALTGMMRGGEVTRPRAEQIATMVMRTNASQLYKLGLK